MRWILLGISRICQQNVLHLLVVAIASFMLGFHVHFIMLGTDISGINQQAGDQVQCDCLRPSPSNSIRAADGILANSSVGPGSQLKIFCWILTTPANHWKAKHVRDTWARRCNKFIFMSTLNDSTLPAIALPVQEGYGFLWAKTKAAFTYVYNHHLNDSDFFLKVDDDTFVVMENLRYMLRNSDPNSALYAGRRFRPFVSQGFMSGGAGYVLSREAVRRFVDEALPSSGNVCKKEGWGPEDVNIGTCLEMVGVKVFDSLDELGRERFHPLRPEIHLDPVGIDKNHWLWGHNYLPTKIGDDSCSDTSVSFHYMNPGQMRTMEFLIYRLLPQAADEEAASMTSNATHGRHQKK